MDDRLLATYEREFTAAAERAVKREFEARRNQPNPSSEIPVIGSLRGFEYSPHAPREQHVELEDMAVRAVLARRWWEDEAPKWAQPLPLTEEDCVACFNRGGGRRASLVGEYGRLLRSMWWHYERAPPFEVFCARKMAA